MPGSRLSAGKRRFAWTAFGFGVARLVRFLRSRRQT
ncbi:hypothetical protein SAMN02745830_05613 [Streptomyces sp. Amel2xC10]|nr:hypothetical protein SAMN02745830_05613 [Streptomyces sp. Amel2xC10]